MNLKRLLIAALLLDIALLAVVACPTRRDSSVPAIRGLRAVTLRDDPPPIDRASSVKSLPSANVLQNLVGEPPAASNDRFTTNQPIGPANMTRLPVSRFVERSDAVAMATRRQEMARPAVPTSPSSSMIISNASGTVRSQARIPSSAQSAENADPNKSRSSRVVASKSALPVGPMETSRKEKPADGDISQHATAVDSFRKPNVEVAPSRGWPRGPFTPEEQLFRAQYGWQAFDAASQESALEAVAP